MEDFEAAVRKLIDSYKGQKLDRAEAVAALRLQADLLTRDETWNPETPKDEGTAKAQAGGEEAKAAEDAPVEPEEDEENDYSGKGSGKKKK